MRAKLWAVGCGLSTILLATAAEARDWNVEGKGQIRYQEANGTWAGLPRVRVRLMDSDIDFDDEMAQGFSDSNGHYDLHGRGGDPQVWPFCDEHCSKPDPYIQYVLEEDGRVDVRNLIGFSARFNTPEHSNTAGSIDFGSWHVDHDRSILYARANRQYDFFASQVGGHIPSHGGTIGVIFPAVLDAGVPYTTEESIHWPGSYTSPGAFDAVYHEFGHRIRHAADGGFLHFLGDVVRYTYLQQHWEAKSTNPGFAFNEGWAEYHSTLLDANERNNFHSWAQRAGGDSIEGNVAAKLLKLSETCGGFPALWNVLRGVGEDKIHSYAEFHAAFMKAHPSCGAAPNAHLAHPGLLPGAVVPHATTPPANHRAPIAINLQQAALRKTLDEMDARGGTHTPKPSKSNLAFGVSHAPAAATVTKMNASRVDAHKRWEVSARQALRTHILSIKPATVQSLNDGSHAKEVHAARAAFVMSVAQERLAHVATLKQEIARERAAARDPKVQKYLDSLSARYTLSEQHLHDAIQNRNNADFKAPEALLPRSLTEAAVK